MQLAQKAKQMFIDVPPPWVYSSLPYETVTMSSKRSLQIISVFLKIFKIPCLVLGYNDKTKKLYKRKHKFNQFWYVVFFTLSQFSMLLYITFSNGSDLRFDAEKIFSRKILSYCLSCILLVSFTTIYTVLSNGNIFVDCFNLWSELLWKEQQFWK